MIDEKKLLLHLNDWMLQESYLGQMKNSADTILECIEAVEKQPKISGWIPCSERLPKNEQEVEITYIRQHYLTGETLYLTARAFYEDGTLTTEKSAYNWNETDNWEYDDKTDSCIIPEGWFESVSFTEEFGVVDMPVIAWKPITEPYKAEF